MPFERGSCLVKIDWIVLDRPFLRYLPPTSHLPFLPSSSSCPHKFHYHPIPVPGQRDAVLHLRFDPGWSISSIFQSNCCYRPTPTPTPKPKPTSTNHQTNQSSHHISLRLLLSLALVSFLSTPPASIALHFLASTKASLGPSDRLIREITSSRSAVDCLYRPAPYIAALSFPTISFLGFTDSQARRSFLHAL